MRRGVAERLYNHRFAPGDVVLDLGANVGTFSEYCLRRGAVVHAYEPDPLSYAKLERLKKRYPGFHPHNAAVGASTGTALLYHHPERATNEALYAESSSLLRDKINVGDDVTMVQIEDIFEVLGAHERIALIKIDIEGGEYDIYDAVIASSDRIDRVFMETHAEAVPSRKADHDRMVAKIESLGLGAKFNLDWF